MDEIVLQVVNGWAVLPASLKLPTGLPRFNLEFPANLNEDTGARYLVMNECRQGYELPTQLLLEKVLRAGDLFVDVGAHWGYFTLQAATHRAGNIRVIDFEPDPANAAVLFRNIVANRLTEVAHLVCTACGDRFEIAPLVENSSMMHSIRGVGLKPPFVRGPSKWVPVVTLDTALGHFPLTAGARLILKVDAEGFEPQVIAGASELLNSGRVALIIWECGYAFLDGAERSALIEMIDSLSKRNFRHFRPPGQDLAGPLTPFRVEDNYVGNVFSLGPGLDV
jgi:FkbM family methyltransferase